MKNALLSFIFTLALGSSQLYAQGLTPSTVRQVFSLQKGDSLEYHMWNVGACIPYCNYYFLKIVDSTYYNVGQDTLSINFSTQLLQYDSSGGGGQCSGQCSMHFTWPDICPIAINQWILTSPDSSIIGYLDSFYQITNAPADYEHDSIFINSSYYNNSKQNFYSGALGFDGTTDIYADSIGVVYKAENVELESNNREQLIYYHKANGKTWGTPYIVTGIANVYDEYHISLYPNPAANKFVLHTNLYQGMEFELYNVLSEKMINIPLQQTETAINRNQLPSGIYYWQMTNGISTIKSGKLILE